MEGDPITQLEVRFFGRHNKETNEFEDACELVLIGFTEDGERIVLDRSTGRCFEDAIGNLKYIVKIPVSISPKWGRNDPRANL